MNVVFKKEFLLLLLVIAAFAKTAKADYVILDHQRERSYCVNAVYAANAKSFIATRSINDRNLSFNSKYTYTILEGFDFENGRCVKKANNKVLGMSNENYHFTMALTGMICGTLIVVSLGHFLRKV